MTKVFDVNGEAIDFEASVNLMDDETREEIAAQGIEGEQEFLEAYAAAHLEKFGEGFAPYEGLAW